jgi:hypothetical protein
MSSVSFFALTGYLRAKAARKTLVKSTQSDEREMLPKNLKRQTQSFEESDREESERKGNKSC